MVGSAGRYFRIDACRDLLLVWFGPATNRPWTPPGSARPVAAEHKDQGPGLPAGAVNPGVGLAVVGVVAAVEGFVAEVAAEVGVAEPAGAVAAPLPQAPTTTSIAAISAAVPGIVVIRRSPPLR
jgi:hypothetical protein